MTSHCALGWFDFNSDCTSLPRLAHLAPLRCRRGLRRGQSSSPVVSSWRCSWRKNLTRGGSQARNDSLPPSHTRLVSVHKRVNRSGWDFRVFQLQNLVRKRTSLWHDSCMKCPGACSRVCSAQAGAKLALCFVCIVRTAFVFCLAWPQALAAPTLTRARPAS